MGKLIKLNSEQKKFLSLYEKKIEKDLDFYKEKYSPPALAELEYLVNKGFYDSLPNAIAEDLFFGSDMDDIKVFNKKTKQLKATGVM